MTDRERMPKYLERLISGGWEPSPGEVVEVNVQHDYDCAHWQGEPCACDPDVKLINHQRSTPKE